MSAHRKAIQDMKPMEAVEHLLWVIEEMTGTDHDPVVIGDVVLTGQKRAIYRMLERAKGQPVHLSRLRAAMGTEAPDHTIQIVVHQLRKRLPPQIKIVTERSRSGLYSMQVAA